MTQRFIVKNDKGLFQTPRRNTGSMYMDRTQWSESIDDARVFQSKGAASNSARQAGIQCFEVVPVSLVLAEGET